MLDEEAPVPAHPEGVQLGRGQFFDSNLNTPRLRGWEIVMQQHAKTILTMDQGSPTYVCDRQISIYFWPYSVCFLLSICLIGFEVNYLT